MKIPFHLVTVLSVIGLSSVGRSQEPIAYYTFAGNANDQSGNGNNATPKGNYSFVSGGLSGVGALSLTGDNSLFYSGGGYLSLPPLNSSLNDAFTLSVWVDDVSIGGNPSGEEMFISFGDLPIGPHSNPITEISINNNGSSPFLDYDFNAGTDGPVYPNNFDIDDPIADLSSFEDSWQNLVMVYQPGELSAYLDGSFVGEVDNPGITFDGFPTAYAGLNTHWFFDGSAQSARMSATYDNVAIYNTALSSGQVEEIYSDGGLPVVPDSGLGLGIVASTLFAVCGLASLNRNRRANPNEK